MLAKDFLPEEAAVTHWPFWNHAWATKVAGGLIADNRPLNFQERCYCLTELVKLSRIVCQACGGKGHNDRYCGTREKLTALGKVNAISGAIIANARKELSKLSTNAIILDI